jgi:hypothetical protein
MRLAAGFPDANVFEDGVLAERGGVVAVLDDERDGALPRTATPWRQSQTGFQLVAENGDRFGSVLAVGDFDGDGFADLAFGVPFEDDIGLEDRGHINVLYGTPEGFVTTRRVAFHFDLEYIGFRTMFGERGQSSAFDMYGGALGVGDFNGDGRHELAMAFPRRPHNHASHEEALVTNAPA